MDQWVTVIAGTGVLSGGIGAFFSYRVGKKEIVNKLAKTVMDRLEKAESRIDDLEVEVRTGHLNLEKSISYLRKILELTLPLVDAWGPPPTPPDELHHMVKDLIGDNPYDNAKPGCTGRSE